MTAVVTAGRSSPRAAARPAMTSARNAGSLRPQNTNLLLDHNVTFSTLAFSGPLYLLRADLAVGIFAISFFTLARVFLSAVSSDGVCAGTTGEG